MITLQLNIIYLVLIQLESKDIGCEILYPHSLRILANILFSPSQESTQQTEAGQHDVAQSRAAPTTAPPVQLRQHACATIQYSQLED